MINTRLFELELGDGCGSSKLSGSSDDGGIGGASGGFDVCSSDGVFVGAVGVREGTGERADVVAAACASTRRVASAPASGEMK